MLSLKDSLKLSSVSRRNLIVLFGIALFAVWGLQHVLMKPIYAKQSNLATLHKQVRDAELRVAQGDRADRFLNDSGTRTVGSDPAVVALRYQEWLIKRTAAIKDVQITANSPIPEQGLGARVPFVVEGETELTTLTELLDEIQATPLLHRIDHLNIVRDTAKNNTAKRVRFSFELEAWALNHAVTLSTIPDPLPLKNRGELTKVVSKQRPFERGYLGTVATKSEENESKPKKTEPLRPTVDTWKMLKLVGAVTVSGKPQAWFSDSRTSREQSLEPNDVLEFEGFEARIVRIDRDFIEVVAEGRQMRWPLGATLREIQ